MVNCEYMVETDCALRQRDGQRKKLRRALGDDRRSPKEFFDARGRETERPGGCADFCESLASFIFI